MISFSSITMVNEYLDMLKAEKKNLIIFSFKDNIGYWFNQKIQSKFHKLGLQETLLGKSFVGYTAIICKGEVIHENLSDEDEISECTLSIDGLDISVKSKPFRSGNESSIVINGKDYSVNDRGLNIVIFDLSNNILIDSVSFDTHVQEYYCTRIKEHYDIGVVGCWWGSNYGSCLNGYAIYKILKSFGLSVWMINRHDLGARRDTQNYRFVKRVYPCDEISPIIPMDRMHEINDRCDIFLAGSDQIWKYFLNRIFDMEYMLNFVDDKKKKLSFGSSFGHGWDTTPKEKLPYTKHLMQRFHAISVREESGVEICKDVYGLKAEKTIEPVFCLDITQYNELVHNFPSDLKIKEPFILTYILDPTPEIRKAIISYSKLTGMQVYNVLDLDFQVYDENVKALNLPNTLPQISPEDLMRLYSKCSFVITDSFHGTSFSIIFNKPFISITNYKRGAVRFSELLEKFGLLNRLITETDNIPVNRRFLDVINYEPVNRIIKHERDNSVEWLKKAIDTPLEKMNPIIIPENTVASSGMTIKCTGCSACVNICPVNALDLHPNKFGYYTPSLNIEKCISCGKCVKTCPDLNLPQKTNSKTPTCYSVVASSKELLQKCSSGGAFPLLAAEILKSNGYVVGAAWAQDLTVKHIIIDNLTDLEKLQKSKYLQSFLGNTFQQIKTILLTGKSVLFTGCPCQIAGLKAYLGRDYDNLFTIDLLCGNAPSSMFFKKYIEDSFPNGVSKYGFRHKIQGWNADCVTVTVTDGTQLVLRGGKQDNYQRVYHNHTMCPPHCENCKYQSLPRYGDLTIGDFWGIENRDASIDASKGVSVILCNNSKGKELLNKIPKEKLSVKKEVPLKWLGGNGYALEGCHNYCSNKRDKFYDAIKKMSFSKAVNYALKPNHGSYNPIYSDSNALLQYASSAIHFKFDPNIWEEHFIDGHPTLIVRSGMSKVGNYATLSLCKGLTKGKRYKFSTSFKVKTDSPIINFHIKDSGSNYCQIIYSYNTQKDDCNRPWQKIEIEFSPDSNIYDEFMIGASQISGSENYIAFEYINIAEL